LAINKEFRIHGDQRATVRLEVINVFDNPWYAALASTAHGNTTFGRVNEQGNYSRTFQLTARYTF
jgi:outer membrane receptor protein involved in Fe transport